MGSSAPSVRRLLRLARRRHGLARACEAASFGAAAGGITLAAAVASGAPVAAPGALLAAALSGALCAVGRPDARYTARSKAGTVTVRVPSWPLRSERPRGRTGR